jgi:hypothetical protein
MGKQWVVVVAALVLAGVVAWGLLGRGGPSPEQLAAWRQPSLRLLPDARMLVVEAQGDPELTGAAANRLLFKAYFALPGKTGGFSGPSAAPRARWLLPPGADPQRWDQVPRSQWTGLWALPLPEGVSATPDVPVPAGLALRQELWHYGEVAELLHQGPYGDEAATIDALHRYIQAQGRVIVGPHEEVYIKGPGLLLRGDPARYLTLIRYAVAKPKPKR